MIPVRSLLGIGAIPSDRTSASKWLKARSIEICVGKSKGGKAEFVSLSDLPEPERLAWIRHEIDDLQLDQGDYDDAAHEAFMAAPKSRRDRAEGKAAIARLLVSLGDSVIWAERLKLVHEKFGKKGNSKLRLLDVLKRVQGIDPINYAPALLDNYKGRQQKLEIHSDAWRFFMTMIRDAAPEWPLIEAWRRVRDASEGMGWGEPASYSTFYRRWLKLTEAQRLEARLGERETARLLKMHAHRDKTTIGALEWVSLDGRTKDFWVDWGDGKPIRCTFIALVDVASNVVLDWELAPSENGAAVVRLIKRVCSKFGIIDNLYPDNGPAFAGNAVAGGSDYRFRFKAESQQTNAMGICAIMGIKLRFAQVKNAQAKIAERVFATLSRSIDDGPEFKGAHAGHSPGASPTADITPVPVDKAKATLRLHVHRYNNEAGRRSQGASGRSYWQVFEDSIEQRKKPLRRPTARQLYLGGLLWKPVAVDRFGQVHIDGWTYGGPTTQEALIVYNKGRNKNPNGGVKINLGRDPDDLSAPAIAYDQSGEKICEGIEPIKRSAYDSVDGIRDQARKKKAAAKAAKAATIANDYLDDVAYNEAMAALEMACAPKDAPEMPPQKVVAGQFNTPFQEKPKPQTDAAEPAIPEEFFKNMDTELAAKRLRGGKSA